MSVVLGVVELVAVVVIVVWLLSLPEDETVEEELLGLVAGNWSRFRDR